MNLRDYRIGVLNERIAQPMYTFTGAPKTPPLKNMQLYRGTKNYLDLILEISSHDTNK